MSILEEVNTHLPMGLEIAPFVKRMIGAPFTKFAYHLGYYGTAAG